ncbi:rRNA maturation RNase YbeY [Woeseia oceani]|uniref:rRNA maturation RNase YbeY n=1 Tax=Woeseia oceani TaxID=1548547 RepID=UPI001E60D50B|nr:rRNA maturation RNase YbeY [Woeseia oceani]
MHLQVACGGDDLPDEAFVQRWLQAALEHVGYADERGCEIAVRLVDADEGRDLNNRYRQRDYATNVLSFAGSEEELLPEDEPVALGDLVLCPPVVLREAAEQNKRPADHWAHLLVHGTLHLLGYDHEAADDAAAMEKIEIGILATAGIRDPYQEQVRG